MCCAKRGCPGSRIIGDREGTSSCPASAVRDSLVHLTEWSWEPPLACLPRTPAPLTDVTCDRHPPPHCVVTAASLTGNMCGWSHFTFSVLLSFLLFLEFYPWLSHYLGLREQVQFYFHKLCRAFPGSPSFNHFHRLSHTSLRL